MKFISSISQLAPEYDAFILDLWGVIHDGKVAYPGVHECLEQLKKAGKKLILLSNAPRRAETVSLVMDGMGIERNLYDAILTSGEAAYGAIKNLEGRPIGVCGDGALVSPYSLALRSRNYTYMGLEKDRNILSGLGCTEVSDVGQAGFALISHSFTDNQPMQELQPLLDAYLAARLTVWCINPDMEVVRQSGERVYCAGQIAAHYESMGGNVVYFGKPHPLVYETCFAMLSGIPKSKILAIGDSPRTDILGANRMGIASAIVTGGILHHETGDAVDAGYLGRVEDAMAQAGVTADMVLERFNW